MKIKLKKDNRDPFWKKTELEIQSRAARKDKNFVLSGPWKKFIRRQNGIKIYRVSGEWIRNNLYAPFRHGGHGYVCEYIPLDEIWISNTHPNDCRCKNVKSNQKLSDNYFESTMLHEMVERELMKKGVIYWKAHLIALQKEIKAKILPNPFSEFYD